ncbi:MAG: hypothetical protein WBG46_00015 [Nonlabens sp.]
MNFRKITIIGAVVLFFTSCVSQQKYLDLEKEYQATNNELLRYKASAIELESELTTLVMNQQKDSVAHEENRATPVVSN